MTGRQSHTGSATAIVIAVLLFSWAVPRALADQGNSDDRSSRVGDSTTGSADSGSGAAGSSRNGADGADGAHGANGAVSRPPAETPAAGSGAAGTTPPAHPSAPGVYNGRFGRLSVSGYIQPAIEIKYRPDAVPRDRWSYGADPTRTGVVFVGNPIKHWSYVFHMVIGADVVKALTSVNVIDRNGDGTPEGITTTSQSTNGVFVEEATVGYAPMHNLGLKFGQMRIPFTVQHESPNTALMFPNRSGPNQVFLQGTDLGALATAHLGNDAAIVSGGVFNGTGVAPNSSVHGILYAGRVDLNLLGPFPFGEGDLGRGPLRIGIGAGALYFPSSTYDDSGFLGAQERDLRASASFRLAYRGFYFQTELLRRQRTDSLSSRPLIATGGYAQASYFFLVDKDLGLAPIGRWGMTVQDQSFDPRTTVWTEAGLSFFFHPRSVDPDGLKLTVNYVEENRVTEGETAYGMISQMQLRW